MTARENQVTVHDSVRSGNPASHGWLNLVYPGLAQLTRGQRWAAACFAAGTFGLIVLFLTLPEWRILTVIGMTVLTALSILDVVSARSAD